MREVFSIPDVLIQNDVSPSPRLQGSNTPQASALSHRESGLSKWDMVLAVEHHSHRFRARGPNLAHV